MKPYPFPTRFGQFLRNISLVEVMIAIAILGLMTAIAIPNFVRARELAEKQQQEQRQAQTHKCKTGGNFCPECGKPIKTN